MFILGLKPTTNVVRKFLFLPSKFFSHSENFGKCFIKFFFNTNKVSHPPPKIKEYVGVGKRNYFKKIWKTFPSEWKEKFEGWEEKPS
jgi:hypothetical protein